MSEIKSVSIFGEGKGVEAEPDSIAYKTALEVGQLLGAARIGIRTGAGGGIMEAASNGAALVQGAVEGCYMWDRKPNAHVSGFHASDLLHHDSEEVQYGGRLGWLLEADAFIAFWAPNGFGTKIEVLSVYNLNQKLWSNSKKLAIVDVYRLGCFPLELPSPTMTPFPAHLFGPNPEKIVDFILRG